jgi:hypothetical protein
MTMIKRTRPFVFQGVYEMAALVEACVENEESLGELGWADREVQLAAAKFSKISLLHRYIYAMIAVEQSRDYRKNADLYEADEIADIEALLQAYEIDYLPYDRFRPPIPEAEVTSRVEDPFYQWFLSEEAAFESLWERLTDEAFHLLFANRSFLLKFNRAVAEHLRRDPTIVPQEYLGPDGRIRRQPVPVWVRDAVFFRDHGRCVLCQVDLSGLLSTDRTDHLDHMVSLADWGPNDPCNIQLLCEPCNLRKASGEPITGNRYCAWWRY